MQLKHVVVALAVAGMLSTQAYASEAQVEAAIQPAQAVAAFTDADLQALFEASDKPMQLAALSQKEMKETEGAWWPVVYRVGGGLAGMYGSGYGYLAGGGRSPTGFLGSVAGGFGAGLWSPVTGYRSGLAAFGSGFTGGAIAGFGGSRGWW